MVFDRFRTPDGQEHQLASSILRSVGNERDRTIPNTRTMRPAKPTPRPQTQTQTTTTTQTGTTNSSEHVLGGVANTLGEVVNSVGDTVVGLVGALTSLPGVLLDANGTLVSRGRNVSLPAGTQVTIVTTTQIVVHE